MITVEEIKQNLIQLNLSNIKGINTEMEFFVWELNEMDILNKSYEVEKYVKGYYAIGSNGGGEMLTVDLKSEIVYAIPFISIDSREKIKIADSLMELVKL